MTQSNHSFGPYQLDRASRVLTCRGRSVGIQRKALNLIELLIDADGRMLTRQQIFDALWPGAVVSDAALSRCVMKARRALDQLPEGGGIVTVHGEGFRWVAVPAEASDDAAAAVPAPQPRGPWMRVGLAMAAAAVFTVLAAVWISGRVDGTEQQLRVALAALDDRSGDGRLDWASDGITGLLGDSLRSNEGVDVVLVGSLGDQVLDAGLFQVYAERFGSTHLVAPELTWRDGVYALAATVLGPDGGPVRLAAQDAELGTAVGAFAEQLVREITGSRARGVRVVSADPFVNEAYARAEAASRTADLEDSVALLQAARRVDPESVRVQQLLAMLLVRQGHLDEAEAEARDLLERSGPVSAARSLALDALASLAFGRADYALAAESAEEGLRIALALDDLELIATHLLTQSELGRIQGDPAGARAKAEEIVRRYQEAGLAYGPIPVYGQLSRIANQDGDTVAAEAYAREGLAANELVGNLRYDAELYTLLGRYLVERSDDDAGVEAIQRAMALYEQLGDVAGQLTDMQALIDGLLRAGRLNEADAEMERFRALAAQVDNRRRHAEVLSLEGRIAYFRGDWRPAADKHLAAAALFAEVGDLQWQLYSEATGIGALIEGGWLDEAAALLPAHESRAQAAGDVQRTLHARRHRAFILGEQDRMQEALVLVQAMYDDAHALQSHYWQLETTLMLADTYRQLGQLDQVEPLVAAAEDLAAEDPFVFRLRARYLWDLGDRETAIIDMLEAKTRFRERWDPESEAELQAMLDAR